MSGFCVPVVNFVGDSVKGYDVLHEWGGNSGGKETYEDVMVHDASVGNVTLESWDVALKWRGEPSILFDHSVDEESGNDVLYSILAFKCGLELSYEVILGSKGHYGADDGFFSEGICSS